MNKFVGKITSIIFVVNDLFVLKCKVFVLYDDMRAEYIGQVQPQPYQYKGEYLYIDADDKPRFKVKGFGVIENYRNKSAGHGTTHVISLMHDFAKDFLSKINDLQSLAARPIENIKSVLEGTQFYCADPLTAHVTYKPNLGNMEEQKKMKLCGCKEPCFEIGEMSGHLGLMCKHLTEKEDGAGNGLITFCKKFNTPVETYKEQYDQLINDRQKTKDILTQLADKLACNTSCNDIRSFMEYFRNINVRDENFDRCCIMFRHTVNIALKLDKNLNTIPGVSVLRLAADIEIDGSANSREHNGIVIAKGYHKSQSRCKRCALANGKIPCEGNIFADKFGYVIRDCNQYQDSKINILLKNLDVLYIPNVHVINSELTIPFTKYGYIEILEPDPTTIRDVYTIIDQFRPNLYFREEITRSGSINIWIYETRKSYKDHIIYILNNCKHNITSCPNNEINVIDESLKEDEEDEK